MHALLRRAAICLIIISSAVAQETWVAAEAHGTVGVPVLESPLPPRLLWAWRSILVHEAPVWEFAQGRFHLRAEPTPQELVFAEAAVYDAANARIVVWCSSFAGGLNAGAASLCSFDGARWSVRTANLPPARVQPSLAYDPARGAVVLYGGLVPGSGIGVPRDDTWELRGSQWTQVATANAPPPRYGAALGFDPQSRQLVLCGGGDAQNVFGDTWTLANGSWGQLPVTGPVPRRNAAFALDPQRQRLVLYGGLDHVLVQAAALGDAHEWNGGAWVPTAAPAAPLTSPSLLRDGNDLLLCGRAGDQLQVWRRVGTTWTQAYAHQDLPGEFYPAFAFDDTRGELVRFGGQELYGSNFHDDTWRWRGSWQQLQVAPRPAARARAAMAFDPLRAECVLFGGYDGTVLGDTWVWNGSSWARRLPALSPAPRYHHAMAFDPGRGTVVLHGGTDGSLVFQDTWEWNGGGWNPINTPPPSPRSSQSLAYDSSRAVMALYVDGGASQPSELWELQGGAWIQANTGSPMHGKLVYDPARGNLVLFDTLHRFDYLNGVFLQGAQPSIAGYYLVDGSRQQILCYAVTSMDQPVFHSVPVPASAVSYGAGCGPLGETTLAVDRVPQLGSVVHFQVRALAPAPVLLALSLQAANVPLGNGCNLLVGGAATVLTFAAASGWVDLAIAVPASTGLIGVSVHGQALAVLPSAALGFSNGVQLRLGQ